MLENEINTLAEETNVDELSKSIVSFKVAYLRYLEEIAEESDTSFIEGYSNI